MIVLDEQLLGRRLEETIARWYPGAVCYITDLRPHSVIKDDTIPELLRRQNEPTFVTINEKDFWRKVPIDLHYCVVCFTLSDSRVQEISPALRTLLQQAEFNTKARRMGTVVRISDKGVHYYTSKDKTVRRLSYISTRR